MCILCSFQTRYIPHFTSETANWPNYSHTQVRIRTHEFMARQVCDIKKRGKCSEQQKQYQLPAKRTQAVHIHWHEL